MKIMLDDGAPISDRAHKTDAVIDTKSPVNRAIKIYKRSFQMDSKEFSDLLNRLEDECDGFIEGE